MRLKEKIRCYAPDVLNIIFEIAPYCIFLWIFAFLLDKGYIVAAIAQAAAAGVYFLSHLHTTNLERELETIKCELESRKELQ